MLSRTDPMSRALGTTSAENRPTGWYITGTGGLLFDLRAEIAGSAESAGLAGQFNKYWQFNKTGHVIIRMSRVGMVSSSWSRGT
jgi:hypothetical protein